MRLVWPSTSQHSYAFSWFSFDSNLNTWILFAWAHLTTGHLWFKWWLCAEQASSHYLHQWLHSFLTHTCVTRPQGIKVSHCIGYTLWHRAPFRILGYRMSWHYSAFGRIFIQVWILFLGPLDHKPSLIHIMAWHRTGVKPLSAPTTS